MFMKKIFQLIFSMSTPNGAWFENDLAFIPYKTVFFVAYKQSSSSNIITIILSAVINILGPVVSTAM